MNGSAVLGLAIMIGSQAATLAGIEPFASWNTPICWTGFIGFADAIVFQARGRSWLRSAPGEFAFLALVSIPLWLVFEFYNLFIENWYYTGLPDNFGLRMFGYAWSYATIWPAIFEGADLISVLRGVTGFLHWRPGPHAGTPARLPRADPTRGEVAGAKGFTWAMWVSVFGGLAMLAWPLVWPSRYLAAAVWLGFIFLLDPLNARVAEQSLAGDLGRGQLDRMLNLALSGLLCGLLWEFWNYWSRAKWHYTVPIMEDVKLFEMPLPGYFGFPAFALECFTMYVFVRRIFGTEGRPIAL